MKTKTLLFAIFMSFTAVAVAQIIHVPADQPSIQAGIDAATTGDIVLVDEGTYFENINFKGKAITVASLFYDDGDTNHINNTIIDGSQPAHPDSASVVYFISGEDTTSIIKGFTIQNGGGTLSDGGGIYCKGSGPSIEHNKIINNSCEGSGYHITGGGISCYSASNMTIIIRHNQISENSCIANETATFGVRGGGISITTTGECIIENNTITLNYVCHGAGKYAKGGGISCYSTKAIIKDNITNFNFVENTGTWSIWGGGIYGENLLEGSLISGNMINENAMLGTWGYGAGIGIFRNIGSVIIDNNSIKNNQAWKGGGIVLACYNDIIEITNNVIKKNSAVLTGGGIFIRAFGNKEEGMAGNYSSLTKDQYGQSKLNGITSSVLANNTITENSAGDAGGAISYEYSDDPLIAFNNIIYENTQTGMDIEIFIQTSCSAYLYNNDLDTNKIYSFGWFQAQDNIFEDPQFEDDSCHLLWNSPCIGMGADSIEVGGVTYYCPDHDFDWEPRPQQVLVDIGVDETPFGVRIDEMNNVDSAKIKVYPNPLTSIATIEYELQRSANVSLKIFTQLGQEIETLEEKFLKAGTYQAVWNAQGLPAGVYFYRLMAGKQVASGKVIVR